MGRPFSDETIEKLRQQTLAGDEEAVIKRLSQATNVNRENIWQIEKQKEKKKGFFRNG